MCTQYLVHCEAQLGKALLNGFFFSFLFFVMGLFRKIEQYILWIYICASNSMEIVLSYK